MENQLLSRHDDFVMGVRYLFQNDLRKFDFDSDLTSNPSWHEPVQNHIDLPRIREGRLGGQVIPFFLTALGPRWSSLQTFIFISSFGLHIFPADLNSKMPFRGA